MHEQDTKIKTADFVPFVLRRGRELYLRGYRVSDRGLRGILSN